jgi:ABC-type antimicrobial peptide transport system permease subunit
MALGSLPRQVLTMILSEAGWISFAGIICGLGATLLLTRLVKSLLYAMQPNDPIVLSGSAVLLAAVGIAASWIPATRAASIEPMQALRHE